MKVPYFRAKDKDSDQWVEGFYAEFPEHSDTTKECRIVHAIMVVVPSMNTNPMMGMMSLMSGEMETLDTSIKKNTMNYCTIDISTLQLIGEVEIGQQLYKPDGYIKPIGGGIIL